MFAIVVFLLIVFEVLKLTSFGIEITTKYLKIDHGFYSDIIVTL